MSFVFVGAWKQRARGASLWRSHWKWAVAHACLGVLCAASAAAQPHAASVPSAPAMTAAAGAIHSALFVSDEWHDLTRKDGSGLYFDIVKTVFARQGVKVEYRIYPYARAVQRVQDRQADGWVASFLNEKSFPLYPKYHFDKNEQTILYKKSQQLAPVTTAALRNKRVAWLRDFGLDRFITEPMRVTELDTIASAFQMLDKDRIDYFVGAKSDLNDYIHTAKQDMSSYGMAYGLHLGLYMAFADTLRGKKLREMWDTEMESFHKTEEFKSIYKKYGYPYPFP